MNTTRKVLVSLSLLGLISASTASAEIYIDASGNYQLKASNGNRVTITPARVVYYNDVQIATCPVGYDLTKLFGAGQVMCDGRDISVVAAGINFTFDGQDLGIVSAGQVETKELVELTPKQVQIESDRVVVNDGASQVEVDLQAGKVSVKQEVQGSSNADTNVFIYEDVVKDLGAVKAGDDLVVDLKSDVLFEFNSAEVRPSADATLEKVAYLVKTKKQGYLAITGHTDSVGSREYNQELSERRAGAVAAWFSTRAELPLSDMIVQGVGEDFPVALNVDVKGQDDPAGREKNRRVEIVIQTVKKEPAYLRTPRASLLDIADVTRDAVQVGVAGARVGVEGAAVGLDGLAKGLGAAASALDQAKRDMNQAKP